MNYLIKSQKHKDGRIWTPPSRFIPAGTVLDASVVDRPAYINKALRNRKRVSGAKKAGMKFEKDAHEHFTEKYGDNYIPGQWFCFHSDGEVRNRTVQPDALHIDLDAGVITIFEIKLAHTVNAWWQLRELYEPIVRFYYGPSFRYKVVEIFKWNKVAGVIPEKAMHVPDPLYDTEFYKLHKLQGVG